MIGEFSNVQIQGMSSAVPEYLEKNTNFVSVLGPRRTKKQIHLTGVSKRHISGSQQRVSDLCYAAALPLMEKLGWKSDEIKVLIYITQGPNYKLPSTAFFLQYRLGLPKDCVCFDINLGCSSFNVGVHVVSALLQSCDISDKALLLIGDTASKVLSPESPMTEEAIANRMIFGAAGAAIALEKVEKASLKFMTRSDGNGFEAIIQHFGKGTTMDGTAVFQFAINDVSDDVNVFKDHFGLNEKDIDYYVFHQAQKLILDNIAATCEFPDGKELRSLDEYGNTSGTSVPLTVCANRDKFMDMERVKLFLCGFGVGLSWGTIFAEIPTENILPVITTNEHYDDDKIPVGKLSKHNILVIGADQQLGENISRYLSDKSANIILAGSDRQKLCQIQDDLFFESHVVTDSPTDNSIFDTIERYCTVNKIYLHGVVFADKDLKQDTIYDACLMLQEKGCLRKDSSIVLTSNIEKLYIQDKPTYYAQKAEFEEVLLRIRANIGAEDIRVNAVLYDDTTLDLTQITGSKQEWIEKYLNENRPLEMKRPLFLGKAIVYLLSDDSQFTTGTLVSINR
jgi:3-oxoacyl-[acyl-carrier-protein] synthase-3